MTSLTRRGVILCGASCVLAGAAFAQSPVPAGYPGDYAKIVAGAEKEGKVVIYTSTDLSQVKQLTEAFRMRHPKIEVEFNDLGTNGTYNRVISEAAANQVGADLVWTNAMDAQIKLVTDGYGQPYGSPEAKNLPDWAVYKDMAYGTTIEPLTLGYNTKLLPKELVPKTRADLVKLMKERGDLLKGKVATFDPEKAGSGFLFHTNDLKNHGDKFWELVEAFGKLDGKLYSSTGQLREKLVSGEHVLVFNIIGSYALDWAKENPTLGVAFAEDYTQTFSRPMFVAKGAPHPNAAKLFIDFVLSTDGQKALVAGGLPAIRTDIAEGGLDAKALEKMASGNLKPIRINDALLEYMDQKKRAEFFRKWNQTLGRRS